MIFTKNKEGVWAIRAIKYKKYVAGKNTRARAPLALNYTSNIRIKKWYNKYENGELDWKTIVFQWFVYQVQSYWNTDLKSRETNFRDTLHIYMYITLSLLRRWTSNWIIYIYLYICLILQKGTVQQMRLYKKWMSFLWSPYWLNFWITKKALEWLSFFQVW